MEFPIVGNFMVMKSRASSAQIGYPLQSIIEFYPWAYMFAFKEVTIDPRCACNIVRHGMKSLCICLIRDMWNSLRGHFKF